MKRLIVAFVSLLSISPLIAQDDVFEEPKTLSQGASEAVRGGNILGQRIYRDLASSTSGNVLISPLSAHIILALTLTGSSGLTAKQLSDTLGLKNNPSAVRESFREVLPALNSSTDDVIVRMANKIYAAKNIKLNKSFVAATADFRGDIENVNFANAKDTAALMNRWIAGETNGTIRDVVNEASISAATRMVLVDAIYFYGRWDSPFQLLTYSPMKFHVSTTDTRDVPQLYRRGITGYWRDENLEYQLVEIPYRDRNFNFYVVLPDRIDGLRDLEAHLPIEFVPERIYYVTCNLYLPKFRVEYEASLVASLQKLGIKDMFNATADLSGITSESVYVDQILQKAFISVDEAGTEAAVATVSYVVPLSGPVYIDKPIVFRADRPFLYFIQEKTTKAILFFGRYSLPTPSATPLFNIDQRNRPKRPSNNRLQ